MQKKTITKVIRKKMFEWLSTITDKNLAKDVRDNLVVSGGCIASLFLNEDVNDYDVYITDISVLERLAIYYTKNHRDITVLNSILKDVYTTVEAYNSYGISNQFTMAVDNLKEGQVRLLIGGDQGGTGVNKSNKVEDIEKNKYTPDYFSPNAISLSNDVQVVTRFSGTVEEIHKSFDFIHATNYFTMEDGLVTNKEAVESLLTKQLGYQGSLYPLTSIIRSKKFILRGYKIGAGEYLKIMYQISLLDLNDVNVLEEQLIGVDVAYFGALIKVLRNVQTKEKDSFKLEQTKLFTLIDEIFN